MSFEVDEKALARHMALVLLFGAARADATPEQLDALKAGPLVALEGHAPLRDVAEAVFAVMGPEWAPTGEWLAQIEAIAGGSG